MRPSPDAGGRSAPRAEGECVELAVRGDLDMAATFRFETEADRLLAEPGVRRLVVDLAETRFIDSSGVGALLSIRERTAQLGVELVLASIPGPVQRVLDLTGTSAAFGTQRTRNEERIDTRAPLTRRPRG